MSQKNKIVRVVAGYHKIPGASGYCAIAIEYKLKPIPIEMLRKLFNYRLTEDGIVDYDLVYCYNIDHAQAAYLQDYVIDGIIDLDKYDFMLESYAEMHKE